MFPFKLIDYYFGFISDLLRLQDDDLDAKDRKQVRNLQFNSFDTVCQFLFLGVIHLHQY